MATTKMWPIKGSTGSSGVVIRSVIEYIENPQKTEKGIYQLSNVSVEIEASVSNVINYTMKSEKTEEERYVTAINCNVKNAIQEMLDTKNRWNTSGNRLMWHGYQSFAPGEVNPETAHDIGVKLARELYGDRFEVVVATHLDRSHIHNHFVINAVSFIDGKKLDWDKYYPQMKMISDRLCKEHSLSVVQKNTNSGHYHRGAIRAENEGKTTLETIMIEDVDACIMMASDIKNFFQLMESKGYRIDTTRSYLRIYPPGHSKCIRLDRRMRDKYNQGEAYTLEGIKERILANQEYRKKAGTLVRPYMNDTINTSLDTLSDDEIMLPDYQDDYYTSNGIPKGRTISGMGAYYIRYMTAMGVYPVKSADSISKAHYYFREDVLKLDKYVSESRLLIDNEIETIDDLKEYRGEQIKKLTSLKNMRGKLQNRIRRCSNEEEKKLLKSKLKDMNKEVRAQKKVVYYCYDIEESQRDMKRKANMVLSDMAVENQSERDAQMDLDN